MPPPSATMNSTSVLTVWVNPSPWPPKLADIPAVVASNTNFDGKDATLADLQRLAKDGVIRRHLVIERGGIRFGIFGLLGKEAVVYATGRRSFVPDAIETAQGDGEGSPRDREGGCGHLP